MASDPALVLSVPILAGVFALVGSWLGSRWGRKNDYEKWLRDQKQEAYSVFLGAFDALYLETGRPEVDDPSVQQALFGLIVKQGRLSVVGPSDVRALTDRLVDEVWEMVQAARGVGPNVVMRYSLRDKANATAKDLSNAVRRDLRIPKS